MTIKVIISVIVTKDDKILMIQEGKDYKDDLWNFPTGELKPGEKVTSAAIRKALGEGGYDVKLTGLLKMYNYFVDETKGWHVLRLVLGAESVKEVEYNKSGGVKTAKWMTFDELEEIFQQGKIWSHNMMRDAIETFKRRGLYDIGEILCDDLFMERVD